MTVAGRLRFSADLRLRSATEFQEAYRRGRRLRNECFSAVLHTSDRKQPRLGLSIAARVIANAVQRNRLRRQVREGFRLRQHLLPPVDIVIGAMPGARTASREELRSSLQQLWDKIAASCSE